MARDTYKITDEEKFQESVKRICEEDIGGSEITIYTRYGTVVSQIFEQGRGAVRCEVIGLNKKLVEDTKNSLEGIE